MDIKIIIGIVAVVAVILIAVLAGVLYYVNKRDPGYDDKALVDAIRVAYADTAKDPDELDVQKIEQIRREDGEGRSVFDVRIKFLAGENVGRTLNFRYYFMSAMSKSGEKVLGVESVAAAPSSSPLRK